MIRETFQNVFQILVTLVLLTAGQSVLAWSDLVDYSASKSNAKALTNLLAEIDKTEEVINGPNCFSTAAFIQGFLPVNRTMGSLEIKFWLQSPLCIELKDSDDLQTGDVVFFTKAGHIFTWIDKDVGFEKECYFKTCKYQFKSVNTIFKEREEPNQKIQYFRCESFQKIIDPANSEIKIFNDKVAAWEISSMQNLRENARYLAGPEENHKKTFPIRKQIEADYNAFVIELTALKTKYDSDEFKFIFKALFARINGIYSQAKSHSLISKKAIDG